MIEFYNKKEKFVTCDGIGQTYLWGKVNEEVYGATSQMIEVKNSVNKNINLIAQILIMKNSPSKFFEYFKYFITGKLRYIVMFDGPIIIDQSCKQDSFIYFLEELDKICKKQRIYTVQILGSRIDFELIESAKSKIKNFGFQIRKWATLIVNLDVNDAVLWKNLKHSARQNINKCKTLGLQLKAIESIEELENLFGINYRLFRSHSGLPSRSIDFEKSMWKTDKEGIAFWYVIIDKNNRVLSTLGMYCVGDMATETTSAINPECYFEKIPAQDYIHWCLLNEAKRKGMKRFDLGGINPNPATKKEQGIRRFKEKWGGEYIEYYELIREPKLTVGLKKIYTFFKNRI